MLINQINVSIFYVSKYIGNRSEYPQNSRVRKQTKFIINQSIKVFFLNSVATCISGLPNHNWNAMIYRMNIKQTIKVEESLRYSVLHAITGSKVGFCSVYTCIHTVILTVWDGYRLQQNKGFFVCFASIFNARNRWSNMAILYVNIRLQKRIVMNKSAVARQSLFKIQW